MTDQTQTPESKKTGLHKFFCDTYYPLFVFGIPAVTMMQYNLESGPITKNPDPHLILPTVIISSIIMIYLTAKGMKGSILLTTFLNLSITNLLITNIILIFL